MLFRLDLTVYSFVLRNSVFYCDVIFNKPVSLNQSVASQSQQHFHTMAEKESHPSGPVLHLGNMEEI